jgi:hypothetical protein
MQKKTVSKRISTSDCDWGGIFIQNIDNAHQLMEAVPLPNGFKTRR